MKRCEWCDTRLEDEDLVCPSCLREVREVARAPAAQPPPAQLSVTQDGASAGAPLVGDALPAAREKAAGVVAFAGEGAQSPVDQNSASATAEAEPDASVGPPCPEHPQLRASGTCHRCGRFLCIRCVPELLTGSASKPTCPDCLTRNEVADAEKHVPKLFRSLGISLSLMALVDLALGALFVSRVSARWAEAVGLGVVFVVIGLGVAASVVMLLRSRDASWSWVALGLMLVPPVAALILSDGAIGCGVFYLLFLGRISWATLKLQGHQRVLKTSAERKLKSAQAAPSVLS